VAVVAVTMAGFVDTDPRILAELRALFADPLATFPGDAEQLTDLLADLPAEARKNILHSIILYQWLKRNPDPDIRPYLVKTREAAAVLLACLEGFDLDDLASELLDIDSCSALPRINRDYPGHPFDSRRYRDRIDGMLADLRDLIFWLDTIHDWRSRKWKNTKTAHRLVRWVAQIIEEYAGPISRRDKRGSLTRLRNIITIADPDIRSGTIDEVLKSHHWRRRGEIKR
jgi:hypothetical protein